MDILEDNELSVEEEQTISFLQTTLGIAQTRLNEMLIKSINDEARLRQTINNLQIEIDQLKSEDDGSQGVDSSNGRSQITTK
jgi:coenzyme F420-reducing hydrogenase delta subunit